VKDSAPTLDRNRAALAPWVAALLLVSSALAGCNTARARAHEHTRELSEATMAVRRPVLARPAPPANAAAPRAGSAAQPATEAQAPASTPGCPAEMARVDDSCVDRYEASLVERTSDGKEAPYPAHQPPLKDGRYEARSVAGALPQGYISRVDSEAACQNAGKRLCTVREWYSACRGSKKQHFPYGDTYVKRKCNSGKAHLLGRLFGNNARNWSYELHFNSPRLNREPGFLSPTGEYSECVSDYGVYDMVGNLHEWVSDPVEPALGEQINLVDGIRAAIGRNRGHGVFMGGFFSTTAEQGQGCHFTTLGHEPRYHDYSTGFRCCKDAAVGG
jgi:formylglycine-generating enzyme